MRRRSEVICGFAYFADCHLEINIIQNILKYMYTHKYVF